HYLYDAGGNAVSGDMVAGPPRRVQWKAGPMFGRHHDVAASISAAVSAGGRVFYIIDEGPASLMHYPPQWRLVARDAFNGVLLWKRPIPTWADYRRPFRSGPPQLPRRLVAVGDRVYVTLGLDAPISVLDSARGKTKMVFSETAGADEILLCDGVLICATCDPKSQEEDEAATRRGVPAPSVPRSLVAVDAKTGRLLWRKSGDEMAGFRPAALAAATQGVVFQCGDRVRCVELRSGEPKWQQDRAAGVAAPAAPPKNRGKKPARSTGYFAPTLVVSPQHGVVLSADRGRLVTLSLDDGAVLWTCPCASDFHAPADVFLADGLVWAGLFAAEGRDPKTGEIQRAVDITGLLTPGHHPRCYRNKATERFIITDKRGLEFIALGDDDHSRNNWARGGCQYGMMPGNGMVYIPPNACCCYAGAMLHGFYALAPEADSPPTAPRDDVRLEKGPAFASLLVSAGGRGEDWPTFRGDAMRSGSTDVALPASLSKQWEAAIGGKLTTPVIADGRLLVASVEQGRVVALDATDGKRLWSFDTAGRIDTPPTLYGGLALFGATDGWVYCLSAADGELVWRFRAAPRDRRIVVDGKLESVWPVHGNVLVVDGVAYMAAGRSAYLDGGIYLYGLDPATGKVLCKTQVAIPHEKDQSIAFVMAGARPDVLVTDGKYIYLQQLKFDKKLVRQPGFGRHLMCHSGLADDSWFYRTFWRLGYGDSLDFPNSYIKHDLRVPFGQLLVFDDRRVCGLQTFFSPGIVASAAADSGQGCMLYGDANTPFTPDMVTQPDADYPPRMKRSKTPVDHEWTAKLPFQARAMLLGGKTLYIAGWPDVVDPNDPQAAPEGRKGGLLWTVSAEDGAKLSEQRLDSPPVFDGMAAAGGKLYMATKDGKIHCFGGP
ncbi:MAG: PQQ-binding-like beta-propeller repeat protein, partial [Planctomycetes bacterium]|nr:PQQ-binding-like beta-propeller repeat protein [Planctomycetota bacterium]